MREIWRREPARRQFQSLERIPAFIGGLHHIEHAVEGDGVGFGSIAGVAIIIACLNKLDPEIGLAQRNRAVAPQPRVHRPRKRG